MINNENTGDNAARKSEKDFAQICAELTSLYVRKNHDYGNAFADVFNSLGQPLNYGYALGMLRVKVQRVQTLMTESAMVKNESIEDSLMDLASYAIMTLMELHK